MKKSKVNNTVSGETPKVSFGLFTRPGMSISEPTRSSAGEASALSLFRENLETLARTRSAGNSQVMTVHEEILPALYALNVFLSDLALPDEAKRPYRYLLEAFSSIDSGIPHDLFKFKKPRGAPRALSIEPLREHVVHLLAVTSDPGKQSNRRSYDGRAKEIYTELKDQIDRLKLSSRGRPKSDEPRESFRGWQAITAWLARMEPSKLEIAEVTKQLKSGSGATDKRVTMKVLQWLAIEDEREYFRTLDQKAQQIWIADQIDFVRFTIDQEYPNTHPKR